MSAKKSFIIGIAGGSGSGKTTFIKQMRARFSEEDVCIISQDDYYFSRDLQECDENNVANFDKPKSINKKKFVADVQRLLNGEVVEIEEYTFNNKDAKPDIKKIRPAAVIVVEGLFVLHYKKMRELLDMKVFFYAADHLKVIRRIVRDQVERGYPIDDVLYRYERHVMPSYRKYIEPYMQDADLIVNNNKDFALGLDVLCSFIQSKIRSEEN